MIVGIGTDLCDIRRIGNLLDRFGDRFTQKIFTQAERARADSQSDHASSYAKRFAAKEAVAKALAGHKTGALSWHSVEVINSPSGKPSIILRADALKRAKAHLDKDQDFRIHLSLSDDYPYALAYAVFEAL